MNVTDTPSSKLLASIEASIEKVVSRQFDSFGHAMQRRFDQIDQRFDEVDRRFDGMDRKFKEIDRRFDKVDQRFDENDLKQNEILDAIGARFDDHEKRITALGK